MITDGKGVISKGTILFGLLVIYTVSLMYWDYLVGSKIAFALLIIGFLVLNNGMISLKHQPYIYIYSLFILFFVVHTVLGFSRDNAVSWEAIKTLCLNLLIAVCCINILSDSRQKVEKYMKWYIISAILVCVYVVIVKRNSLFSGELTRDCIKLFSNQEYAHNDVPGYAVIALFFIAYFLIEKRIGKKLGLAAIAFFMIFIILSGARKSLIGALIAIVVYPYLYGSKRRSFSSKLLRICIVMLAMVAVYIAMIKIDYLYNIIGYKFQDVLIGLISGKFEETSSVSRNKMITIGIELIKESPLVGYGLRAWSTWPGLIGSWSHNMLVELTFSGGICAALIYYSFFVIFFVQLKRYTMDDQLGSMLFCYMVFMIIHDMLSVSYLSRMVALIYCFGTAYLKIRRKELGIS